jgi:DNA-binding response OmpR family regulator
MIVEDDAPLRRTLAMSLRAHGYDVVESDHPEDCLVAASRQEPDVVLLDLSLPGGDGFSVLRRLRAFSAVPVVVLTVRDRKDDRIAALDAGADDYVTKPFDTDELFARLRAALRRRPDNQVNRSPIHVGALTIDLPRGSVVRDGEAVHLTGTELRFLELLISSGGRLLTHGQVAAHLAARSDDRPDAATLRVYVGQRRRKLGDDAADPKLILTHHGIGYRWIANEIDS